MDGNQTREAEFLAQYRLEDYKRPSIAVDIALFTLLEGENKNYRKLPEKRLALLLVKRAEPPFEGMWVLPGGFLREQETLEEAARRELCEETGVNEVNLRNFKVFSETGRDPRGWILSNAYFSLTSESGIPLQATKDAKEAVWAAVQLKKQEEKRKEKSGAYEVLQTYQLSFPELSGEIGATLQERLWYQGTGRTTEFRALECKGIGFDHAKIIAEIIIYLREELFRSNLGFDLLPEEFTLFELQKAYEEILDQELLTPNFRRKTAELVLETEHMDEGAGHRPARLYRRNLAKLYDSSQ